MENRITPEFITSLKPNEIFVFGSNLQGMHAGGAARCAMKFGAEWGNGVGLQGNTYAIPTLTFPAGMDTEDDMLDLSDINRYVQQFIAFAKAHPELFFYVTPIGCGIAGFTPRQIAPLFRGALELENVSLPKDFLAVLNPTKKSLRDIISGAIHKVLREEHYI